jgi:uncharacterized ion transporter superfamily protein YfcC
MFALAVLILSLVFLLAFIKTINKRSSSISMQSKTVKQEFEDAVDQFSPWDLTVRHKKLLLKVHISNPEV